MLFSSCLLSLSITFDHLRPSSATFMRAKLPESNCTSSTLNFALNIVDGDSHLLDSLAFGGQSKQIRLDSVK